MERDLERRRSKGTGYYLFDEGREQGPFTVFELQDMAEMGLIKEQSLVRLGSLDWSPAASYSFLSSAVTPSPLAQKVASAARTAAAIFGILYMLIAAIAAMYHNWLFAKEQGFLRWVFYGEIYSTIRGFLWPYDLIKWLVS